MRRIARSIYLFRMLLFVLTCCSASAAQAQTILVQPYVQPGDGSALTGSDVKVICWWTDQKAGDFSVHYKVDGGVQKSAIPTRIAIDLPALKVTPKKDADGKEIKPKTPPEKEHHYFKYTVNLSDLPFNSEVNYSVKLGDRDIRSASFRTRATADKTVRCVMVGDLADNRAPQKQIAYQIAQQKPEFLVALGDIVYERGRLAEYMHHYWDTYVNVADAGPKTGAPLMASVPFYTVLGNHDVAAKIPAVPDALAAYYVFSPPKNGPGIGPWVTPLGNDKAAVAKFRAATTDSYPYLDVYSFDYGPAHFVVLNVNPNMKTKDPIFQKWFRDDLKNTNATWRIVCFHMPGFHSTITHYPEQQARSLQPLFEECGVDITFAGHVHNYQRTVPLKFAPDGTEPAKKTMFNGQFTLDTEFDGVKNTRPKGVIHITAGGGGAKLYGPSLDKTAPKIREAYKENFADFTAKLVMEENSFVVLDLSPQELQLRAVGVKGNELDRIRITK